MLDWFFLPYQSAILALESQRVVILRLAKLAQGGSAAQSEAVRMVTEKAAVGSNVAMGLILGGSHHKAVKQYRARVRANARRLSRKKR
jgi:hypothetical protein